VGLLLFEKLLIKTPIKILLKSQDFFLIIMKKYKLLNSNTTSVDFVVALWLEKMYLLPLELFLEAMANAKFSFHFALQKLN
jgi:hypothetical protein